MKPFLDRMKKDLENRIRGLISTEKEFSGTNPGSTGRKESGNPTEDLRNGELPIEHAGGIGACLVRRIYDSVAYPAAGGCHHASDGSDASSSVCMKRRDWASQWKGLPDVKLMIQKRKWKKTGRIPHQGWRIWLISGEGDGNWRGWSFHHYQPLAAKQDLQSSCIRMRWRKAPRSHPNSSQHAVMAGVWWTWNLSRVPGEPVMLVSMTEGACFRLSAALFLCGVYDGSNSKLWQERVYDYLDENLMISRR